jgi:hypothetical protein
MTSYTMMGLFDKIFGRIKKTEQGTGKVVTEPQRHLVYDTDHFK